MHWRSADDCHLKLPQLQCTQQRFLRVVRSCTAGEHRRKTISPRAVKAFEGSNPSLSANYFSHGISCSLSNAENRAILSVLVSQPASYILTQSHSRGGTSRFWYITYRRSYRDPAAMMAERGVVVTHTTIMCWVLRYVPEYEERWNRYARPVHSSWRMDETAIRVRGKSAYHYRAVDKHGKSVDSLLRDDRGIEAAQAFFRKAVATQQSTWPRKVTLDGHAASHRAVRLLGDEDPRWKSVLVRSCRYLNNIVEQDHRAIKRRCASMLGFKSIETAATTLAGVELAHRIHKGQFFFDGDRPQTSSSLKSLWDQALAPSHTRDIPRNRFRHVRPPMH